MAIEWSGDLPKLVEQLAAIQPRLDLDDDALLELFWEFHPRYRFIKSLPWASNLLDLGAGDGGLARLGETGPARSEPLWRRSVGRQAPGLIRRLENDRSRPSAAGIFGGSAERVSGDASDRASRGTRGIDTLDRRAGRGRFADLSRMAEPGDLASADTRRTRGARHRSPGREFPRRSAPSGMSGAAGR